jgi:subtilisin family serine protease
MLKPSTLLAVALAVLWPGTGVAQTSSRAIVRSTAADISAIAGSLGLTILRADDSRGIYLVSASVDADAWRALVEGDERVLAIERDTDVLLPEVARRRVSPSTAAIFDTLPDRTLTRFYGSRVWAGYVNQTAAKILRVSRAQHEYATGAGVVAIIDTGIDASHPVLRGSIVAGYDFIRNSSQVPSDLSYISQSTAAILEGSSDAQVVRSAFVNQSTAAILEQSTAAILEGDKLPAAFGHGTMVAGLVRLVAPTAAIMPLRVFASDGTADTFDVVRAIYWAVDHGASVINMSFSLTSASPELVRALNYATERRVICVASVGNSGLETLVFPAAFRNVIGVGSTTDVDTRSAFSNYGSALVKVAAPGERLITAYPGGNYAAVWGTSFSAAFVSGGAALLVQAMPLIEPRKAEEALTKALRLDGAKLGEGRLDLVSALEYLRE